MDFNAPAVLVLAHLGKAFGATPIVDDLSLAVPPGCLFGLVGRTGSGKTATLAMAAGLLRPDRGTVSVLGHDMWADPVRAKALVGVALDGVASFDRLTGAELLALTGELRGMRPAVATRRAGELLQWLGLAQTAHTVVADYSADQKKRIGLACALVHNPPVVLVDEPFVGVDPVSTQIIQVVFQTVTARGGTVIMASHAVALVEEMCDALAVIAGGRVAAWGTMDAVCAGQTLQQRFVELVGAGGVGRELPTWLGR